MSTGRGPSLLDNDDNEDIPESPAIPSGRLASQDDHERVRTTSQCMDGDPSHSNLVHRRGASFDNHGNPRSYAPGSSQVSVDGQLKGTTPGGDVEAQAPDRFKGRRATCLNFCRRWYHQIDFQKWYEWTAYYVPILEWLPQYKGTLLPFTFRVDFSKLYFSRFICWIDVGEYFYPNVSFICCVNHIIFDDN